jgi:pyruvate/oxaloacetate carboxyltransferase
MSGNIVRFVEETFRDGQLSLWATRMDTRTMLGIAGTIDQAGFQRACISSGAAFDTAVRFLREDPWERLRLLRGEFRQTPIEFLVRGRNLIGWKRYPNDVAALLIRCLRRTGFDWMLIFDGLNDFRNIAFHIRCAKAEGLKVSTYLSYADSPVHTDEYWVRKALELVALGVDVVQFGDPAGLFNPERARTLIPALLKAIDGRAELLAAVHTSTGQAQDCYNACLQHGVRSLSTVALPLANSESLPATTEMMARVAALGLETEVDSARVRAIDSYFSYVAMRDQKPVGKPVRYDEADYRRYLQHQIPGGMMSNFVRQHREAGTLARLPEILDEMGRVRAELGYPPMVTPWSQLVGVQATLNVTSGERYGTVPDELKLYARGFYGELPAPIDPNVLDRILLKGDKEPLDPAAVDEVAMLPELRTRNAFVSDEELILRIFYDESTLDAYRAAMQPFDARSVVRTPLCALVEAALSAERPRQVSISIAADKGALCYADASDALQFVKAANAETQLDLTLPGFSLSLK